MRKVVLALLVASCLWIFACRPPNGGGVPPNGTTENDTSQMKLVALGDSLAMGIQDAGLVNDSQYNDFPYLIAKQMGNSASFEQPYVDAPGIGVPPYKRPLELQSGEIIQTLWDPPPSAQDIYNDVFPKLSNKGYPEPYNNLAVNGAVLWDLEHATTSSNSAAGDNYFFDIVLRNLFVLGVPYFGGKTAVQEALMLDPDVILLWIGNNDVLGTVLVGAGTDNDGAAYTDPATFTTEYTQLLTDLKAGSHARIVMATIPGYLPFADALDGIYQPTSKPGSESLTLFDPTTFEPINFGSASSPEYVPLLLDEQDAIHLLLTGAIAYLDSGEGIPGYNDLTKLGYSGAEATNILSKLGAAGLNVPAGANGSPLTGDLTITPDEQTDADNHIQDYNQTLRDLSVQFDVPLVDMTASWWGTAKMGAAEPFGGYSGLYAFQAQATTVFSLDGVHPDNLGHALCANEFIKVMNAKWNLKIPLLNPADYAGQYTGRSILPQSLRAIKAVGDMYSQRPRLSPAFPAR